ncbi:shikimate dehydrogenase [Anaeroselena agilis]|uniref:Shikimate dehydrogenase (NADP(+)) n=1 Tax=Anaeroselena agilis TaxID=3063788 RepID=A0ABU3NYD6_9FIRM|nr:shikimate dehydrogenase [Selenomonadales bacterium 4137-cl]
MITGKTRVCAVIGWPVEHSLSPAIHNAAFAAAGLDYAYIPLAVAPGGLAAAVAGFRAAGFAGINVTVPHKVNIIPLLDALDRSAELVGAVNTVVFADGRATGYNTDLAGFVNSLLADGVAITGRRAMLLGAGGAARAVAWGFLEHGAAAVTVAARDALKATAFAASFPAGAVAGCGWQGEPFAAVLGNCDILVNCTPLGMYPNVNEEVPLNWAALSPGATVCDLIYTPALTGFLARARERGHQTVGGAGMLIEQGAAAFALWTGREASRAAMRTAFDKALRR